MHMAGLMIPYKVKTRTVVCTPSNLRSVMCESFESCYTVEEIVETIIATTTFGEIQEIKISEPEV